MQEKFMQQALALAKQAFDADEVPVGCLIVNPENNEIIAATHNQSQFGADSTAHAEILAIRQACQKLSSSRLWDLDMYVTLEPCPMCAGAILNARIKNLYYAVKDENSGGISRFNLLENTLNHTTNSKQLVEYEQENKNLIQNFFKEKRKKK